MLPRLRPWLGFENLSPQMRWKNEHRYNHKECFLRFWRIHGYRLGWASRFVIGFKSLKAILFVPTFILRHTEMKTICFSKYATKRLRPTATLSMRAIRASWSPPFGLPFWIYLREATTVSAREQYFQAYLLGKTFSLMNMDLFQINLN